MTTYPIAQTISFAPKLQPFTALAGIVRSWAVSVQRAHTHRQAAHQLRALNDRMLKDIGIHRSEIDAAVRGQLSLRRAASQQ